MARAPKTRPRGESDLGRVIVNGYKTLHNGHATIHEREDAPPRRYDFDPSLWAIANVRCRSYSPHLLAFGAVFLPLPLLLSALSFRGVADAVSDGVEFGDWEVEK